MTRTDKWIRALVALVVIGLGLVAAVVSFQHGLRVVQDHGQDGLTAVLSPLTVDGLVLAAGLVLLDSARRGERPPVLAIVTLALGIGATLGINILFGWSYGVVGAIVAGWPAVALVLTTELLMGLIRRGQTSSKEASQAALVDLMSDELLAELDQADDADGTYDPGTPVLDTEVRVPGVHLIPDPHQVRAAEVFADEIEAGEVPSVRRIKSVLRVGQPRAEQVRAYLAALAAPEVC